MPYITEERRMSLTVQGESPSNAGDLNFMFTCIACNYLDENGLNYQSINDIIGALEGCKLELYRRVASPYEDSKIKLNGDVY